MKKLNLFVVVLVFAVNVFAADALTERLQRGLFEEEANRNLDAAIREYQAVVAQSDEQRKVTATALFRLGECYRKLGNTNEAAAFYQRVARDFSEQEQLVKLSRDYLGGTATANPPPAKAAAEMTQAEAEELARVKTLAQNSPDLLRSTPVNGGQSELQSAAFKGYARVVEFLLTQGVGPNDPVAGNSPLVLAALRGNLRIVQLLLDKGATQKDASEALNSAAANGFKALAELLLARGADVNYRREGNLTALHAAANKNQTALVELLLQHGAKPDVLADRKSSGSEWPNVMNEGATPLHLAAAINNAAIVKLLLDAGAAAATTNYLGRTPLHLAAYAGNTNATALLLARGANPNVTTAIGDTVLSGAISSGRAAVVAQLLRAGADVNLPGRDNDVDVPLIQATHRGSLEVLSAVLGAKPSIEAINRHGDTALQLAVKGRADKLAELLLEAGADPNRKDSRGYPVLRLALDGSARLVESLLRHGANPNVVNDGETPLSVVLRVISNPQPVSPPPPSMLGQTPPPDRRTEWQQMAASLRQHGADEFLQRRGFIHALRASTGTPIFSKGTNDLNRYTLLEFLAAVYQVGGSDFSFPDFAKINIRRLVNQREEIIPVNAATMLATTNCQGDVPLEWGDYVEIPLRDHPVSDRWHGLGDWRGKGLETCLQRTIRLVVGGTNVSVVMLPYLYDIRSGGTIQSSGRQPFFRLSATVLRDDRFRNLLRSSSDLSSVTVTRTEPQTKETRKMTFDLNAVALPDIAYSSSPPPIPWAHDLWLRDGDVIEVPEKP